MSELKLDEIAILQAAQVMQNTINTMTMQRELLLATLPKATKQVTEKFCPATGMERVRVSRKTKKKENVK